MDEIKLRWAGPTDWHVSMFGADDRGVMLTRKADRWTFRQGAHEGEPTSIPWPGDPATAAECLAMAERVWAEQFGGAK